MKKKLKLYRHIEKLQTREPLYQQTNQLLSFLRGKILKILHGFLKANTGDIS